MLPHALKSVPAVERFYSFPVTTSTNDVARTATEFPQKGIFVFQADRQNAGRGRRGADWFSDTDQGLWVSILARLTAPYDDHFRHNRALACALCDAVEAMTGNMLTSTIKWPNDIFIRNKKVCGILLESHATRNDCIVLGFGLNVNTELTTFPPDLQRTATSLFLETGKRFSLSQILERIVAGYCEYQNRDVAVMHRVYSNRLYGLGRRISVDGASGTYDGVETDGRLRLANNGTVTHVIAGHVTFYDQQE